MSRRRAPGIWSAAVGVFGSSVGFGTLLGAGIKVARSYLRAEEPRIRQLIH